MPRAQKGKVVNQKELSILFGVTTPTINAWVSKGMPCQKQGAPGQPSEFNTADCFNWRLDEERRAGGGMPAALDELRERKMRAEAETAEMNLAQARGRLVPIDQVADLVSSEYAKVRARMTALPGTTAPRIDPSRTREVALIIADAVNDALSELSADDAYAAKPGGRARKDKARRAKAAVADPARPVG